MYSDIPCQEWGKLLLGSCFKPPTVLIFQNEINPYCLRTGGIGVVEFRLSLFTRDTTLKVGPSAGFQDCCWQEGSRVKKSPTQMIMRQLAFCQVQLCLTAELGSSTQAVPHYRLYHVYPRTCREVLASILVLSAVSVMETYCLPFSSSAILKYFFLAKCRSCCSHRTCALIERYKIQLHRIEKNVLFPEHSHFLIIFKVWMQICYQTKLFFFFFKPVFS